MPEAGYGPFTELTLTVDGWAELASLSVIRYRDVAIQLDCTVQDTDWRVMGSLDGGVNYPIEEKSGVTLAAAASIYWQLAHFYTHIQIQVKPTIAGVYGVMNGNWAGGIA